MARFRKKSVMTPRHRPKTMKNISHGFTRIHTDFFVFYPCLSVFIRGSFYFHGRDRINRMSSFLGLTGLRGLLVCRPELLEMKH